MELFYFLLQLTKMKMILDSAHVQSGFHNLFHCNVTKFDNSLKNIFFFLGCVVVDGMIQLFQAVCRGTLASKKFLQFFRLTGEQDAQPPEKKMYNFCNTGGIECELQGILTGPNLWHHFPKQYQHKADHNYFHEEFEKPIVGLKGDDFVDQEI